MSDDIDGGNLLRRAYFVDERVETVGGGIKARKDRVVTEDVEGARYPAARKQADENQERRPRHSVSRHEQDRARLGIATSPKLRAADEAPWSEREQDDRGADLAGEGERE